MKWRLFFEPRDLWVGAYVTRDPSEYDLFGDVCRCQWRVYVCLVPMLPLLFTWESAARPLPLVAMRVRADD